MGQSFEFQRTVNEEPIIVKGPDGQEEPVTLGIYKVTKTFQGETKVTRFVTVADTEDGVFHESNVRLYIPLRGSYEPSDEELIKLFQGEPVFLKDLKRKDGTLYSATFIFDLWADRSFTDRNGNVRTPNFTGDLKFAPKDPS